MTINLLEVLEKQFLQLKGSFDYSDLEIEDALVKQLKNVDFDLTVTLVDEDEYNLEINYTASLTYLDARTLNELELSLPFSDNVMFTSNVQKAEKFDIDFAENEIDLSQLILDLTLASIPLNYSEQENELITKEEEVVGENNPFTNVFNK